MPSPKRKSTIIKKSPVSLIREKLKRKIKEQENEISKLRQMIEPYQKYCHEDDDIDVSEITSRMPKHARDKFGPAWHTASTKYHKEKKENCERARSSLLKSNQ